MEDCTDTVCAGRGTSTGTRVAWARVVAVQPRGESAVSAELRGKQPEWVAALLDQGKPAELIALQRSAATKNELPRIIRPDLLLTETGISVTELDSVPGGIGLTAWLNQTYAAVVAASGDGGAVLGGADGMQRGFASIFGDTARVHVVVSEESATYRPEMAWLCGQLGGERFAVRGPEFTDFADGDAVYRFFELFDLPNVANAAQILQLAAEKRLRLTPPPKPIFEEKLLFALLWNRNLRGFWRRELGEGFLARMLKLVPSPGCSIPRRCRRTRLIPNWG